MKENATALLRCGKRLSEEGRFDQARIFLVAAMDADPGNPAVVQEAIRISGRGQDLFSDLGPSSATSAEAPAPIPPDTSPKPTPTPTQRRRRRSVPPPREKRKSYAPRILTILLVTLAVSALTIAITWPPFAQNLVDFRSIHHPLDRAEAYMSDGQYQDAVSTLSPFVPSRDAWADDAAEVLFHAHYMQSGTVGAQRFVDELLTDPSIRWQLALSLADRIAVEHPDIAGPLYRNTFFLGAPSRVWPQIGEGIVQTDGPRDGLPGDMF